ncbi:Subtilisin-like protease [Melia azedarach]|uniref:Subtilisin-like protease n=1 Tax=Melia azedarach TaxID=155640 RepID=A0ACC1YRB4_MELAZ|nr:Subtilisin-like protease [Melia azedarach]
MGSLPEGEYLPSSHHQSLLQQVVEGRSVGDILVRSYRRSFNGFSAKLTDQESQTLASMKGVVSVFPNRILQLHTTRSWDFLGFNESVIRKRSVEGDIIVGVIDTGISPESKSFSDEGFGPPPKKWKGVCNGGENFTCNNKIIGARYYKESAWDDVGHGSHVASIAAGNHVKDANFFGIGQGTARGGVPSARIAVYKVCTPVGCEAQDILTAFDDAIADGVDLITISLGGPSATDFNIDPIAIGGFHAMAKGILTLNSAGNNGPAPGVTSSVSPWLMSVAASTTDRRFVDKVVLGSGKTVVGYSLNPFTQKGKKFPLIYGQGGGDFCHEDDIKKCRARCVNASVAKGKIVVCDEFTGFMDSNYAHAAGSILKLGPFHKVSYAVSLPASAFSPDSYDNIISYVNSTRNPQAEILKTSAIKIYDAPAVTSFSSRGPNTIVPDILKPDISAPGLDILAAYSSLVTVTKDPEDKRKSEHYILSGTSMSCPHTAGIAAYVKSFHPNWSPSAIKSAIMTTAWPMNSSKNTDAEFAYGSGHVNPVKAIDPGLVYETFKQDYLKMLCSLGYNERKLRSISGDNSSICPNGSDKGSPRDLNYPSMAAQVSPGKSFTIRFPRTVTNVGLAKSAYKVKVLKSGRISVKVEPEILSFKSLNEKKSFSVTVTGEGLPDETIISASLVWSDGNHSVRSPIVVLSGTLI